MSTDRFLKKLTPMVDKVLSKDTYYQTADIVSRERIRTQTIEAAAQKIMFNAGLAKEHHATVKLNWYAAFIAIVNPITLIAAHDIFSGNATFAQYLNLKTVRTAYGLLVAYAVASAVHLKRMRDAIRLFTIDFEQYVRTAAKAARSDPNVLRLSGTEFGFKQKASGGNQSEYQKGDWKKFGHASETGEEFSFRKPKSRKFYCDILGVPESASKDEMNKARRRLSAQFHTDKEGGDDEQIRRINNAYDHLVPK